MITGRLWLMGCGNMGGAMLRRWIGAGIDPAQVTVIDPGAPDVPDGVRVLAAPPVDSAPAESAPDVIVLAVKPQQLENVIEMLGDLGQKALIVSILAGVETKSVEIRVRNDRVIRAMPNLPVAIGKGVVALYASAASPADRAVAEALSAPLGHVEWIDDEGLFDAITALSGSGPGFVFRFVDALARAGVAIGLPADQAARLALATVEGSAAMAAASDLPPATLADRVASKGGSTRKGLDILDKDEALTVLLTATLEAARRRNAEMAADAR